MVVSGAALAGELEERNAVLGSRRPQPKFWLLHLGALTADPEKNEHLLSVCYLPKTAYTLFQSYEARVSYMRKTGSERISELPQIT